VLRALASSRPEVLAPFTRSRRIDTKAQLQTLAARKSPELVNTSNPGQGKEKIPKN